MSAAITDVYGDVWTPRAYGLFYDGRCTAIPRALIPTERTAGRAGFRAGYDHARNALAENPRESAYAASDRGAAEWGDAGSEFIAAFYRGLDQALRDDDRKAR